jgi:DNA mismatch endonuclease (patch repair protein)
VADIVSPEKRSQMMAGIKGKNTKPELLIRKALHNAGFRYRIHDKKLPGKPDLVFSKYKAILFIHGCFWHGHSCHLFKWPNSRVEFWKEKITRNQEVDRLNMQKLIDSGWRVGVIWECSIRGKAGKNIATTINTCAKWLVSEEKLLEISSDI